MKKTYYIFSVLFIIFFSGCRGDQQETLVGTWEQISHYETDSIKVFWEFYAGDALKIIIVNQDIENESDTLKYTYGIESTTFNVFPGVDNSTGFSALRDPLGEYWVDILKKDEFKATKQLDGSGNNAYARIELIKR